MKTPTYKSQYTDTKLPCLPLSLFLKTVHASHSLITQRQITSEKKHF